MSDSKKSIKVDKRLGDLLGQWHSSGSDPIYAVSSSAAGGHEVPREVLEKALHKVEGWVKDPESEKIEKKDLPGLKKAVGIMEKMLKTGSLLSEITRLASEHPEIREHLVPLIKEAFSGPESTGRNWKEVNDSKGHRWLWTDKAGGPSFGVYEFQGPGIPLYRLQLLMEDGNQFKWRRQVKDPSLLFAGAAFWWKALTSQAGGLVDMTIAWNRMGSTSHMAADATIKQIGELVKGKKLVDLRKPLEGMFPKKSINFAFEGGAHYTIKHKGKTILIVNEKYADNPDLVVDGIAIGYDS